MGTPAFIVSVLYRNKKCCIASLYSGTELFLAKFFVSFREEINRLEEVRHCVSIGGSIIFCFFIPGTDWPNTRRSGIRECPEHLPATHCHCYCPLPRCPLPTAIAPFHCPLLTTHFICPLSITAYDTLPTAYCIHTARIRCRRKFRPALLFLP